MSSAWRQPNHAREVEHGGLTFAEILLSSSAKFPFMSVRSDRILQRDRRERFAARLDRFHHTLCSGQSEGQTYVRGK
jgi:hypothetical protein